MFGQPDRATLSDMSANQVLPFYMLCDQSFSMMDHLDTLNEGLRQLHRTVGADPVIAERTPVCLIGFARVPTVLLPLCRLSDITELSVLATGAATNYGATFTFLRKTIERDMDMLMGRSYRVYRPAVFFMSDGQPTDPATWPETYATLTDPAWAARPNMIAFGVGDADGTTIGRIGSFRTFRSRDGLSSAAALREFVTALTTSIVRSGTSLSSDGTVSLHVPERISGFTRVRVELI